MNNYIGIDLGTTNSAICSFDGSETRIWKSPEQNDVTPSAIFIDRRGNKYVGKRAYDSAPHSPDNAALLFKRLMGTSTPIRLAAVNMTMTPEECSSEILKTLNGYLNEEIRKNPQTGTVITVPAAFNQMQKDATMQAAEMAGFGKVALMQEPVAAVMSVVKTRNTDGMFLIYDLGGGTLDIAIAESLGGRVNLLAHGGIAMCGGRDFDRILLDNIVRPWLQQNYDLPDDLMVNPSYKSLIRLAIWATERAKIELSAKEDVIISLSESESRIKDLSGNDIYLDIPLSRITYDNLINDRVFESINAAREALQKAGITSHDLDRVVFVGGPTNYKPLRDLVSFELGISGNTDVNPMTAVAEGASLFAESIDWNSQDRSRKSSRGQVTTSGNIDVAFKYIARTPDNQSKIIVRTDETDTNGYEFQVDSIDTGWTSGRQCLSNGATVNVFLPKPGENKFKVFVFDSSGGVLSLDEDVIVIHRTAATVDAIPASHSIGIEVLDRLGGRPVMDYLIRSGDTLPAKGEKIFKAAESLKAGATGSLNFKLWEGEIDDPISDNRPVGVLKISGSDFDEGVIPAGADLICEYQVLDSGNIVLEISVPSIGGVFHSGKNFYSRQEGQLDFNNAVALVVDEGERTLERIDKIETVVDNPKLDIARQKIERAVSLDPSQAEAEKAQEAMENVLEARRMIAQVRAEHLNEIRQVELDSVVSFFEEYVKTHARPSELSSFENLIKTAQRCIDRNSREFEMHLDELKSKNFQILWRQDWFVIERFNFYARSAHMFIDKAQFSELVHIGSQLLRVDDIDKLRSVVAKLAMTRMGNDDDDNLFGIANIVRG